MAEQLRAFSFHRRPVPVPGDLRISWRIALILMMIGYSRSARASLAKLYILNDVLRSGKLANFAFVMKAGVQERTAWSPQVEPAFARAIDYVVGERLAAWTKTSGRAALQLTAAGVKAATSVAAASDALIEERSFLSKTAKELTEATVTRLISQASKSA